MTISTSPASGSLTKPLLIFTAFIIAGNIILAIIGSYIELPSSIGIIVMVAAAMGAGQSFGNSTRRLMTKGERFRFALIATLIAIVVAILAFWAAFAYYGVPFTLQNMMLGFGIAPGEVEEFKSIMMIIIPIALLINIAVAYFTVGFGARSALKQLEKQGKL